MLTGDNGIIAQARKAKEETQIAAYKEALEIIGLGLETERVDESEFLDRYVEEIKADEMFKDAKKVEKVSNTKIEVITKEGYVFEVTRDEVKYKGKEGELPEEPEEPEIPELQEGDITFTCNPTTPTNISVEVTIETKIELGENWIEYSINNGASWTKYENPIILTRNEEIVARISNSAGSSVNTASTSVTNIDKLEPNEPTLGVTGVTENSITVVANATDRPETPEYSSSGIKGYQFSINNGAWEPTIPQASGTYTFSNLTAETSYSIKVKAIDNANNEKEIENAVTGTTDKGIETIPATSFVGNYADTNNDGTADGIIFADLAVGGSGNWGSVSRNGSYSIPTASNLKEYYIANENYSDTKFGNKGGKLIAEVDGTSGNDRFYIMALEDIGTTTYYWYYNAYGKMNDYSSTTSQNFGTGQKNTEIMIDKWNKNGYGAQNNRDMWEVVQNQVSQGWFVPSRAEWATFAGNLGITTGNYSNYGLHVSYWSSSQNDTMRTYYADFRNGGIYLYTVSSSSYARLCTTF